MNNILSQLSDMKAGQELISEMSVFPLYDENIRSQSTTSRLIALSELYNIYIPSPMSVEIYSKLYLALLRSLQKKSSRNARIQQNENYKYICQKDCSGILGGSDSFTITGCSGIGKSSAITRAIDLITAKGVIEVEKPYTKIIPCLVVQCPFDCSVKGLLLEILRKVDEILNSDYYPKALKSRVTTDMLIGCVSQVYFAKLIMRAEASKNMMRLFFQLSDGRKIITPVFWWQGYLGFYEIDNGTNLRLIYEKNGKGIALKKIEILGSVKLK